MLAWGPAIVYGVVMFVLSGQPDTPGPEAWEVYDKQGHIGGHFGLGLLLFYGCRRYWGFQPAVSALCALLLGCSHALLDEMHQGFVPGRHMSVGDATADLLGVALAQVLVLLGYAVLGVQRHGTVPPPDCK